MFFLLRMSGTKRSLSLFFTMFFFLLPNVPFFFNHSTVFAVSFFNSPFYSPLFPPSLVKFFRRHSNKYHFFSFYISALFSLPPLQFLPFAAKVAACQYFFHFFPQFTFSPIKKKAQNCNKKLVCFWLKILWKKGNEKFIFHVHRELPFSCVFLPI